MIDAKYSVVFIILIQRTCNIFHQCMNILNNPRTSAWPVVIVYRLSFFYRAFVPFKNQLSWHWTCSACPFKFFVGICWFFTNICKKCNDRSYFMTFSDWHFHVITVLTTCLFTTVTIGQMTSYFLMTLGIPTHTEFWRLYVVINEYCDASK
jgi:hypothetical protein